ncbi:enolase C-terminal domain-like protein [Mesorhizobium sp.]|uniref:enolase C-terminal domain-like protein n=1 Tax=Mesorhizobium sp. TaxID=1871066 RepID=UPI00344E9CB4
MGAISRYLRVPVGQLPGGVLTIVGAPDETTRIAKAKRDEGYPHQQVKIGGGQMERDVETVWEAVGNTDRIAMDANRGLTVRDAILLSQQCSDSPSDSSSRTIRWRKVLFLRARMRYPVCLDESTEDFGVVLRAVSTTQPMGSASRSCVSTDVRL